MKTLFSYLYIEKATPKFSESLPPSDMVKLVFEDSVVPPPLSTKEIKNWSCEIDNVDINWWETSFLLNVCSLMGKVSIKSSKLSLIRHKSLFEFFDYEFSNMEKLYIENISFTIMDKNDLLGFNEFWNEAIILQAYNKNINSYCLYYILRVSKLLNSLEEISIERMDFSFAEDLFELIQKELAKSKVKKKIKIMYRDPDTQEEIEITQDYLDKKFERKIENSNSKLFEEVSYEFLLFRMILCF